MKKALLVIFLLFFSCFAISASNGYWLRGEDFTSFVGENKINFMTSTPPNVSSSKTIFSPNEQEELGTWITSSFPGGLLLHTQIAFWSNSLSSINSPIKWFLYDYDSVKPSEILISEGEISPEKTSSIKEIEDYAIAPRHRLKLILKASQDTKLILDDSDLFSKSEWTSPQGETFSAVGIKSTALLFFNQCSPEEIICSSDSGCDDNNPFTEEICENPGTCNSKCTYSKCTPSCINSSDCLDNDLLTINICENAGTCKSACKSIDCSPQCLTDADCSTDSIVGICKYQGTCYAECFTGEDNTSLEINKCVITEFSNNKYSNSSKIDCCGNGFCEQSEQCSKDCEGIDLEIISPLKEEYLLLGEVVNLLVKAKQGSNVSVKGFFGTISLFDDGQHNDQKPNDGVFGNSLEITGKKREELILIESGGMKKYLNLKIIPILEVFINTNKEKYVITDLLEITGVVSKKGIPVTDSAVLISVGSNGEKIFENQVKSNEFGAFKLNYKSFSLDPEGGWSISVFVEDLNKNKGYAKKSLQFFNPENLLPLSISSITEIKEQYIRESEIAFEVNVNEDGKNIDDAIVEVSFGGLPKQSLISKGNGAYYIDTILPSALPIGNTKISITANKGELKGKLIIDTNMKNKEIFAEIQSPKKSSFLIGETIIFEFTSVYENGESANQSSAILKVNGEEIKLTQTNQTFKGEYIVQENDSLIEVEINLTDREKNSGEMFISSTVSGYSLEYYLRLYWQVILVLSLLFLALVTKSYCYYAGDKKKETLIARRKQLDEKLKYIQTRYFKQGSLSRKKYDELMIKYEHELNSINKKMEKIEANKK